jgi:hypothetical protein
MPHASDSHPLRYAQLDLRSEAPIIIVTGFVASTADGVPTTLKRSGSDYSATIFARLMKVRGYSGGGRHIGAATSPRLAHQAAMMFCLVDALLFCL